MTTPSRTIFHIDLDSFFVSAERLRNPSLRDRPIAVGGDGPRGVISSASYEARKFGVRSAMPTAKALKLCKTLVLVPPDFSLYSPLSKQVFKIVESFTPVFEAVSIDEGYLDMTGTESLFGPPVTAAAALRAAVLKATGLTCSVGIASNRLVAKVATDFAKPNNIHLVTHGTEAAFLAPLPVERLPGVGRVTHAWLLERELKTIGHLQRYPVDVLEKHLGKFGHYLFESAWGKGSVEFHEEAKTRSISRERTFSHDEPDERELVRQLWQMCAELGAELRQEGFFAKTVRLKLRYPPFETLTRARTLEAPVQLDRPIFDCVEKLFHETWEPGSPVRLLGVGCVLSEGERQLDLFSGTHPAETRQGRLDHLKDEIKRRFGDKALVTGRD